MVMRPKDEAQQEIIVTGQQVMTLREMQVSRLGEAGVLEWSYKVAKLQAFHEAAKQGLAPDADVTVRVLVEVRGQKQEGRAT